MHDVQQQKIASVSSPNLPLLPMISSTESTLHLKTKSGVSMAQIT